MLRPPEAAGRARRGRSCSDRTARCASRRNSATSALTWQPSCVTSETTRAIRSISARSRRSNRSTSRRQQLVAGGGPRDEGVPQPGVGRAELDRGPLLEVSRGRRRSCCAPPRARRPPRRGRGSSSCVRVLPLATRRRRKPARPGSNGANTSSNEPRRRRLRAAGSCSRRRTAFPDAAGPRARGR